MTKKDYELIAENIKACVGRVKITRNDGEEIVNSIIFPLVVNLSGDLIRDNARFDYPKFLEACGLE